MPNEFTASTDSKVYGNKQQSLEVGSKPSGMHYPQPKSPRITNLTDNSADITYEQTAAVGLGTTVYVQRSTVKEKFIKRDGRFQIVSTDVSDLN